MDKKLILETLINHYAGGNKARFASMIGVTPQLISNWLSRNTLDYVQIYQSLPTLSGDFLLSGKGAIEKTTQTDNLTQTDNMKHGNAEILALCCELVANYRQRDAVMAKLVEILG